jgi:hypothetical protein
VLCFPERRVVSATVDRCITPTGMFGTAPPAALM